MAGAAAARAPVTQPSPTISPNTLRTQSFGEVIAVIGEGPLAPATNLYQQIYLDGVPILGTDGSWNFAASMPITGSAIPPSRTFPALPRPRT